MKRTILIIALAGVAAACDGSDGAEPRNEATGPTASATASAKAQAEEAKSKSHGNGARAVSEETDDFLFEYAYPAEAGRIPELAELLDARLDKQRAELATESQEARESAREEGFPYNKHSYTAEWKRIADLPKWLSLSVDIATYTGGAHGNYTVESLVWDKEAKRAMKAIDLFSSPAALEQAYGDRYCDGLDRERGKRRGTPVPEGSDEMFDKCPGIGELEVLVGSSNGRTFNRLTLYAGPYVAGPYVEGAYEVNLSVNKAILDAVKPEYRDAFSARN
jgi:hypothetical protein